MKVEATKLTDVDLLRRACEMTIHGEVPSRASLKKMYLSEHSPIRTQLFWIELHDIPTFVSVHLVRHKYGVEHYVKTNRDDRGADVVADRNTPVHHGMLINAQAIINISKERLCRKAHTATTDVWEKVLDEVAKVDPDLAEHCVPKCVYRQLCPEPKGCGAFASAD